MFFDTLDLYSFEVKMSICWVLLTAIKGIKAHSIDQLSRFMHLFFAAEKVHPQKMLALFDLASDSID